jgi:hypothetical protein
MQAALGAAHLGKLLFSVGNTKVVKASPAACFSHLLSCRRASGSALQIFWILGRENSLEEKRGSQNQENPEQ